MHTCDIRVWLPCELIELERKSKDYVYVIGSTNYLV